MTDRALVEDGSQQMTDAHRDDNFLHQLFEENPGVSHDRPIYLAEEDLFSTSINSRSKSWLSARLS